MVIHPVAVARPAVVGVRRLVLLLAVAAATVRPVVALHQVLVVLLPAAAGALRLVLLPVVLLATVLPVVLRLATFLRVVLLAAVCLRAMCLRAFLLVTALPVVLRLAVQFLAVLVTVLLVVPAVLPVTVRPVAHQVMALPVLNLHLAVQVLAVATAVLPVTVLLADLRLVVQVVTVLPAADLPVGAGPLAVQARAASFRPRPVVAAAGRRWRR